MRNRWFLVLVFVAALSAGCATRESPPHVIILGLDGVDPDVVDLLSSEGKLPNFSRLRRDGAYGRLRSMEPMLSPILWTTIATGRPPLDHGIGHFVAINEHTKSEIPVTSSMRRVKALWNILSEQKRRTDVVGWWATWPAETVQGSVVSDHTSYHFLFEDGFADSEISDSVGLVSPESLLTHLAPLVHRPSDVRFDEFQPFAAVDRKAFDRPFSFTDDIAQLKWILSSMDSYSSIGEYLWNTEKPDLLLVYLEGTDSASHLFGHLFRAPTLSSALGEQQKKFGMTVERVYERADEIVGQYLRLMTPHDVLLVLSDHGFKLGALPDDPSQATDLRRVSASAHRDNGILYMYGGGVAGGSTIDSPTILDIAPTVLAMLGVSPSLEMPGRVLRDATPSLKEPLRIASYESGDRPAAGQLPVGQSAVDAAIREHLRSLGYLDASSPAGDKNVAALEFTAGRYDEAARDYERIVAADPNDATAKVGLAGTYGALGRYENALRILDEAQRLEPLLPEVYQNRGMIFERQANPTRAVAEYSTALRYSPRYEPSQAALRRLTGEVSVHEPAGDDERRAFALAQQAQLQAKRGELDAAWEAIQQALAIAPHYVVLRQYEANIAYLRGGTDAAISALKNALELEPGNALFCRNWEALRAKSKASGGSVPSSASCNAPPNSSH